MAEYEIHEEHESWSSDIRNLVVNALWASVFFGVAWLVEEVNFGDPYFVGVGLIIVFGIFALILALKAVWYTFLLILRAFLLIFFPVLGFLLEIFSVLAAGVKSIDEGGGLRGIVHRLWYGKNHPPD